MISMYVGGTSSSEQPVSLHLGKSVQQQLSETLSESPTPIKSVFLWHKYYVSRINGHSKLKFYLWSIHFTGSQQLKDMLL